MNKENNKACKVAVLQTILSTAALILDRTALLKGGGGIKKLPGIPIWTSTLLVVACFFFYALPFFWPQLQQRMEQIRLRKGFSWLAALLAFFMVFGESYMKCGSWQLVFQNIGCILLSLVLGVGYFLLFRQLFMYLELWIGRQCETLIPEKRSGGFFERHLFWSSLLCMLLCWAIYMVAFYPVILSPDPVFEIKQFFNEDTKYADYVILIDENVKLTNHHPVAHAALLGGSILLGRAVGVSDNMGLFFYSLFQTLVLSGVLSYSLCYLKKLGISAKIRRLLLGMYCLVPMFPFYAMSGVKDTIFTSLMILYGIGLFDWIRCRNERISLRRALSMLLLLFLLLITRNNGLHVILLSFPFLLCVIPKSRKKIAFVFMGMLVLYVGYFHVLLPGLHITPGSVRETLSIPFQQTARYIREHEEDLTNEDKEAIDKVLGYDGLAEAYNPELADPVKNRYNRYATKEELSAYFKVWATGLVRHPDTYIQATMNNVYGFFYPNKTHWYIYNKLDDRINENGLVNYHYNQLGGLRTALTAYGTAFPYLPVVGLLSNIGAQTWVLFYLSVQLFDKRRRRYLVAFLPFLASVLICVASPANTYFRYTMPYIFAMPTLVVLCLYTIRQSKRGGRF